MEEMFKLVSHEEINKNLFRMLDKDWMLITAGEISDFNVMTASWGGFGVLWKRPVAFTFIRPVRHTYNFAEKYPLQTLSFFGESHRDKLKLCGTKSGRDTDKIKETGLIPFGMNSGGIGYEQASLIIVCKKIYHDDIKPSLFLDPDIENNYPQKDYHRMYICEITGCFIRN